MSLLSVDLLAADTLSPATALTVNDIGGDHLVRYLYPHAMFSNPEHQMLDSYRQTHVQLNRDARDIGIRRGEKEKGDWRASRYERTKSVNFFMTDIPSAPVPLMMAATRKKKMTVMREPVAHLGSCMMWESSERQTGAKWLKERKTLKGGDAARTRVEWMGQEQHISSRVSGIGVHDGGCACRTFLVSVDPVHPVPSSTKAERFFTFFSAHEQHCRATLLAR